MPTFHLPGTVACENVKQFILHLASFNKNNSIENDYA